MMGQVIDFAAQNAPYATVNGVIVAMGFYADAGTVQFGLFETDTPGTWKWLGGSTLGGFIWGLPASGMGDGDLMLPDGSHEFTTLDQAVAKYGDGMILNYLDKANLLMDKRFQGGAPAPQPVDPMASLYSALAKVAFVNGKWVKK